MVANSPEYKFSFQLFVSIPLFSNHLTCLLILLLLLCAGIHPNPGPDPSPITIVQFNCNGVYTSKNEIQDFINKHQVKIVALQETKLNANSKQLSFQNYNLVRRDRPVGKGGGIAFLTHHLVRFTNLDVSGLIFNNDLTIELQDISAVINDSEIKIFNLYIPPASANT
jgi:exonuclease III